LWQKLESYINGIADTEIKAMLKTIFADSEINRRFKTFPAAEFVHHSFRGGLLEHVVEMLDISGSLKSYYEEANYDYVYAGIILHDIGKIFELAPVGAAIERTKEGYLLGHLILSFETLLRYGKDLDPEKLLNLKHIVLAHHGVLEYGSPVIPATIEAAIVHEVDKLSSTTRTYQKVIRQSRENGHEFAEWDKILGTKVYLGESLLPASDE
jgi:3'-5' exoribonuclease